ncbi:MAG: TATA-box-binding protein [Euryarchaeota archaeon HGW-Euryarchaeota-1]|nr:MAG: TATA-box-binding protein [Euryarchaeota archaeon HGW-Euryarchaeota-1]
MEQTNKKINVHNRVASIKQINKKINVHNIVVTEQLDNQIDVDKLGEFKEKGFKYNKEIFPGVFFHSRENKKIAFLIFKTGKVVCTGAKSMDAINSALDELADVLNSMGFNVKRKKEVKVTNIVVSAYIKKIPTLSELASTLDNIEYDPEVFPGIINRRKTKDYSAVILIFKTGRIVCVGINDLKLARQAISDFQKEITNNRNKRPTHKLITSQDFFNA